MKNCVLIKILTLLISFLYVKQCFSLSCGTNCEYTLSDDGLLYVYGTGPNNSGRLDKGSVFLHNKNVKNVIIEEGISYIGSNAFTLSGIGTGTFEIRSKNIEINPYAFDYSTKPQTMIAHNVIIQCGKNCMLYIDENGNGIMEGNGTISFEVPAPFRSKLVSLEIGEGLTEITTAGLSSCNNLTTISVQNEDFKISNDTAFNKKNIKEVATSNRKTNTLFQNYFGENVKCTYIPKRIYTVDEAQKATKKSNKNTFSIRYR